VRGNGNGTGRIFSGPYHVSMITPEMLDVLRCPMDPKREARLVLDDTRLLCSRCRLQYRVREGFPSLLVEEATLPDGCPSPNHLPCQRR
jgi:uncharacterized protein